jgi:hypothetical protein
MGTTVWIGAYDVCNSGGSDFGNIPGFGYLQDTGVGTVYLQAVTDIIGGVEICVDGYGASGKAADFSTSKGYSATSGATSTPSVLINGFHFTSNANPDPGGDTIVLAPLDWAIGNLSDSSLGGTTLTFANGLVDSDGHDLMPSSAFATYVQVGTANTLLTAEADVILDSIAPVYANAQALQTALATSAVGNILLYGRVASGHESDILVAYNTPTTINIADVTLSNNNGFNTADTSLLNPVVHDLVHIDSQAGLLGLANFTAHNIYFLG